MSFGLENHAEDYRYRTHQDYRTSYTRPTFLEEFFEDAGPKRGRFDSNNNNNEESDDDEQDASRQNDKRLKPEETLEEKEMKNEQQNFAIFPEDLQYKIAVETAMRNVDFDDPSTFVDVFLVCTLNKKIKSQCKQDERVRSGIRDMLAEFIASNIHNTPLFGMGDPKLFNDALIYWRDVVIHKKFDQIHNNLSKIADIIAAPLEPPAGATFHQRMTFKPGKSHFFQWLYARKEHMLYSFRLADDRTYNPKNLVFKHYTGGNPDELIGTGDQTRDLYLSVPSNGIHKRENRGQKILEEKILFSPWLKRYDYAAKHIVWVDIASPCEFSNVRDIPMLATFKHIHTLDIKGYFLDDGRFPFELGRELPTLKRLLLGSSTNIDNIPEESFQPGDFPNLEFFSWTETDYANSRSNTWFMINKKKGNPNPRITQIFPSGFCRLPKLKHLILEGVIHSLPTNIGELSKTLETLWICASPLERFPSSFFELTNLKKLVIRRHQLEGNFITEDFARLKSLEWLVIRENFSSHPSDSFSVPPQVTEALQNLVVFDVTEKFNNVHVSGMNSQFGPDRFPSFNKLQLFRIALSSKFPPSRFPIDLLKVPIAPQPALMIQRQISFLISEAKDIYSEYFSNVLKQRLSQQYDERKRAIQKTMGINDDDEDEEGGDDVLTKLEYSSDLSRLDWTMEF